MIEVARYSSVFNAFSKAAETYSDRPFLRAPAISTHGYAPGEITYSYREAKAEVAQLIAAFAGRRLQVGDRVALVFDSRLNVYLHLLALNALGVSIVPLNSAASDAELLYVIEHSDCCLIVSAPEYRNRVETLVKESGDCEVVCEADLAGNEHSLLSARTELSTEAALLYTSGTTGKPKGCMLSNEYFLALGTWYNSLGGICTLESSDRLLTPLPPNHMNALCTSFTGMLLCGGCVIQLDRFHPRSWWQTVREEKATIIHCLGVMTAMLLTLPEDESEYFADQIKFCFGPGSDPRHQEVFENRFGFPLIEAWAMTETGAGGITITDKEPRYVGQRCIGKPVASMNYRIVDEQDADVEPGEPGELLVRTRGGEPRKGFFSGYYKDSAATEEGWRGEWWHTGDVVREGEDGSLFFVDRRNNVIRRSGENIAAVEVEAVLLQNPAVDNCAICAVPDEIRGDEVFAFIVSKSGAADAHELFGHCMKHLTYFKAPGYIAFVDSLPLTASQKVSRGEVKQMARERVASNDCIDLREFKKRKAS